MFLNGERSLEELPLFIEQAGLTNRLMNQQLNDLHHNNTIEQSAESTNIF